MTIVYLKKPQAEVTRRDIRHEERLAWKDKILDHLTANEGKVFDPMDLKVALKCPRSKSYLKDLLEELCREGYAAPRLKFAIATSRRIYAYTKKRQAQPEAIPLAPMTARMSATVRHFPGLMIINVPDPAVTHIKIVRGSKPTLINLNLVT